ncbi:MAG: alpha-mannosidase [Thermoprotei archaeon]
MTKEKVLIVPHTHWDREWYMPFEGYREWLVGVVDRALDMIQSGKLQKFVLDGQSVVAEDYLEIRPDREAEFVAAVKAGKLRIGPWYTQPDEWIPSAEALIRNLQYGIQTAERYGGTSLAGYLPDTFGHVATLPSILNGFGIHTFLFFRGIGDEGENRKDEFIWKAPDGSKVLAVFLNGSYCHAERIGFRRPEPPSYLSLPFDYDLKLGMYYYRTPFDPLSALDVIKSQLELRRKNSAFSTYVFLNGCDHRPPQELERVLEIARNNFPDVEFLVSDLDDYVKEIEHEAMGSQLAEYSGELRGAKYTMVDPGILSTRADVKQKNFYAETSLEAYAEPLSAVVLALGGRPRSLKYPWKLVLRAQAHDSICNSGVDEVNEQVADRLDRAREAALGIAHESLDFLNDYVASSDGILVFNPTNSMRNDILIVRSHAALDGPIEFQTDKTKGPSATPHLYQFTVKGIPPLGYARVKPVKQTLTRLQQNEIENEYFRVSLSSGQLVVFDKQLNRTFSGLGVFLEDGDAGDEYNYSPPYVDVKYVAEPVSAHAISYGDWQELNISYEMMVPSRLEGHRRSSQTTRFSFNCSVRLYTGVRRIDFHVKVDNSNVKDHRLRVAFALDGATKVITSTALGEVEHAYGVFPEGKDWAEQPAKNYAFKKWVAVMGEDTGLLLAARGLYECWGEEIMGRKSLVLTLFRGVGWLSRDDMITRKGGAGPAIATPLSQLNRDNLGFDFSIIPFAGEIPYTLAEEFCRPLLASDVAAGTKEPTLPPSGSLLSLPAGLVLSALKPSEDEKGIIIRVYNPMRETISGKVAFLFRVSKVMRSNLREEDGPELSSKGGYDISVPPKGVLTLKALVSSAV